MKCAACTSEEVRVMTTRHTDSKVMRLRCCSACGHRWTTVEVDAQNLSRMESTVKAFRAFATLSREIEDAAPSHS